MIIDATLLAVEQLNRRGGVLGRRIEPVVVDGRSDGPTFAKGAERLIRRERVSAIFGGYTSASRKTMLPVIERHRAPARSMWCGRRRFCSSRSRTQPHRTGS